jgi:hypothetical protein
MPTGGRKTHLQVIHEFIVYLVTGNTPMTASGMVSANAPGGIMGVLPAGAVPLMARLLTVGTAFDAATFTLQLGTTPGGSQILAAQNIKPLGRIDAPIAVAAMAPLAADTPVYWSTAASGPNATGWCMVWLEYLPGVG